MREATTPDGVSLEELQRDRTTLVVFLRHSGCPFCREALADVAKNRPAIDARGVQVVLVCQWADGAADHLFDKAGVRDVPRLHDPDGALYRAFEIKRGNLWQLFSPWVLLRVIQVSFAGHMAGKAVGDVFQMPGAVLVKGGRVLHRVRYRSQATRPDYAAAACAVET